SICSANSQRARKQRPRRSPSHGCSPRNPGSRPFPARRSCTGLKKTSAPGSCLSGPTTSRKSKTRCRRSRSKANVIRLIFKSSWGVNESSKEEFEGKRAQLWISSITGSRPSQKGPEQYFTGSVRIDPIVQAPEPSRVTAGLVTFEPGARSAWHTHPLGQTLIVTQGLGWTQCEDEPIVEIRAGDVIWRPPNHRHWHGA